MHRILVVEDEEAIRAGLMDLLDIEGYDTASASDGQEAMDKVKQWKPHLVLLDVMLPGKDGFTVANELRAAGQFVPILMLARGGCATGAGSTGGPRRVHDLGCRPLLPRLLGRLFGFESGARSFRAARSPLRGTLDDDGSG